MRHPRAGLRRVSEMADFSLLLRGGARMPRDELMRDIGRHITH
jgi:hypothetical protein